MVTAKSSYLNLFPKADLCNSSAHNCTERGEGKVNKG
jgi:hypothetical protein